MSCMQIVNSSGPARGKVRKIGQKSRGKVRKSGHAFANVIVTVCVGVSTVITASVLWEYHRLCMVLPASVLTALLGFWGGELLILALRQVLGSDAPVKARLAQRGRSDPEEL